MSWLSCWLAKAEYASQCPCWVRKCDAPDDVEDATIRRVLAPLLSDPSANLVQAIREACAKEDEKRKAVVFGWVQDDDFRTLAASLLAACWDTDAEDGSELDGSLFVRVYNHGVLQLESVVCVQREQWLPGDSYGWTREYTVVWRSAVSRGWDSSYDTLIGSCLMLPDALSLCSDLIGAAVLEWSPLCRNLARLVSEWLAPADLVKSALGSFAISQHDDAAGDPARGSSNKWQPAAAASALLLASSASDTHQQG